MTLLIPSNISFVPEKRKFKLSLEEHLFISCYLDITTSCLPLIQSFSVFINTEKAWKRNWLSKEERVISLSLAMLHRVFTFLIKFDLHINTPGRQSLPLTAKKM